MNLGLLVLRVVVRASPAIRHRIRPLVDALQRIAAEMVNGESAGQALPTSRLAADAAGP